MKGSKHTVPLKDSYTIDDIKKVVKDKFNIDLFRLIINGKELRDDEPEKFPEFKKTIKNGTTIYVCQRLIGGSGNMVDVDSHKATILVDLQDEVRKIPTQSTNSECMICTEEKKCIKFCCSTIICKECFPHNFVHADYKLKCLTCNKILPPQSVFVTPQFIQSLTQLDETIMMAKNIDFQICTCGALSINDTMYAKQKCGNCQRWFCFFCNENWDEQQKKMRNEKYTCKVNCFWETKITYNMVDFAYNKNMKIPSRRCCPKCLECGAYDQKCKYHTCKCGHHFCFICLNLKADCERIYKSSYNKTCGNVAQQTFTIFPRLCRGDQ